MGAEGAGILRLDAMTFLWKKMGSAMISNA